MLPTKGGLHKKSGDRFCRNGCERVESRSHVLQRCSATYKPRIKQHDHAVEQLAKAARDQGWTAEMEPRIRDRTGRLHKPNLLFKKEGHVIAADVAVHWEGPENLEQQYCHKVTKYSEELFLEALQSKHPGSGTNVKTFVIGAR